MTNKEIIDARTKPALPRELSRFEPFWRRLPSKPLGPPYLGNFEFQVDRLTRDDILYIKEEFLSGASVPAIHEDLVCAYLFVRPETILNHCPSEKGQKIWKHPSPTVPWIASWEKDHNISRRVKGQVAAPEKWYKDFVIWCIENGYEYYQISTVVPYAPTTIRGWVNDYGYKAHDHEVVRSIDSTGKQSRTSIEDSLPEGDFDSNSVCFVDNAHHSIKLPPTRVEIHKEEGVSAENVMADIIMKEDYDWNDIIEGCIRKGVKSVTFTFA